jgi:hypothetical protein
MKLTDIKNSLNEISAIGGLKQVVKGNTDRVEGIKLSKEMAQAMIDWFNSSPYGRKYPKAAKARLHISLGIMSVMGLDRYAKHKGAKEELKYIKDLSKAMRDNVNEAKGKFKKDDLVYNKRTKTVGIVRLGDDASGEVKTDADGNVNVDELEKYNPIKNKHQSNAKVAPSTEKEVNKRGLFNPFKNESVVNEAKYDIGMARKGNGLTVYNKAEEVKGDYKNVAHIDNKGKIKYLDKKVPSNIKKQIEAEAKKMMEITKEGTMKLKDILKESFEKGKVYSNPFHTPFVKENDEERREESSEMTTEQKQAFLEAVKAYKSFGESIYRKEGLSKVYESIRSLVESAGKNMVKETEGSFDGITVGRHVKRMNESFKVFEKTLREVGTLQQRLEASYDEIGETLGKYYEINESHGEEEKVEEGNEFGAARAKAIANGDSEFSVDGKTYPVKSVDKDDKENAKEFSNESKSMKLTSMLNESFGFGELPSSKLMKMKVSAKDMLASVKNKKINESPVSLNKDEMEKLHKDGEIEKDGHEIEFTKEEKMNEGFSTWEMRFSDMNLGGVKLSKKNVYRVKARNTVEAIKKAAKMAGVEKNWIATETHSLKKLG